MCPDYLGKFGYDPAIPEDIRNIFVWLCNDVVHIQQIWNFYIDIFGCKDYLEVADLLPTTFRIIEETVGNDIIMTISRITDPASTKQQDNLTFRTLALKCSHIPEIDKLTKELLDACEPIRAHRNKMVGHNDLNTRIDPLHNVLPRLHKDQVEKVLRISQTILNTVMLCYSNSQLYFEPIQRGDANDLIFFLKSGKKYHQDCGKMLP